MTVCTMFIMGSGAFSGLKRVSHVTQKLFHLSSDEFITVILSLIGGYPVGAKLLNEAVREKRISAEKAGLMLCYCVNSGPAFAVSAVGAGMYSSRVLGFALLAAHLLPSLIMCFLFSFIIKNDSRKPVSVKSPSAADNFVSSVSGASGALLSICGWVIFFSAVGAYIKHYSLRFPYLKYAALLLEVTNAVGGTRSLPAHRIFTRICMYRHLVSAFKRRQAHKNQAAAFPDLQNFPRTFIGSAAADDYENI